MPMIADLALVALSFTSPQTAAAPAPPPPFTALDDLCLVPPFGGVHQFSSHNKEGHNGDDGWRLYDDADGRAVIFDAAGPGCVRSMWSTDIREDAVFHFHFDGEEEPRYSIPMLAFYKGEHPLFPIPLVSYERRGHWGERPFAGNSFVPIPFAEHLKITVSGELHFYHVLWQSYPHGTPVTTFTGKEDRSFVERAFAWTGPRSDRENGQWSTGPAGAKLDAGGELVLLKSGAPGILEELVLEGPASDAFLRETWIRICWDEHQRCDVHAPLGYFFGTAGRAANTVSLALSAEVLEDDRIRLGCRFPMAFARSARVTLSSRSTADVEPIEVHYRLVPQSLPADRIAYFTTTLREGWTTYGRDWLLAEGPGTGWYVGTVQTMLGEHYCEGDEHIALDGAISPQINGTGSEDYYLGCFWPNREYSSPFACVVGDIQEEGGSMAAAYGLRACYARYHLEAPLSFLSHLDARIQHGGFDTIRSSYGSLAFAYVRSRPALVETDFIDVGNAASEEAHDYAASASSVTTLEARPEGEHHLTSRRETGRTHAGGEIVFTVAVDPANEGVRLRRRLDQWPYRQAALVFVDGERAGVWYHAAGNEHLRWYDSDFDLHPRFTRGKDRLTIWLLPRYGGDLPRHSPSHGPFTEFHYRVLSYRP